MSENISANGEAWREIPDSEYDWRKTLAPERPYIHDYSKTLTYKLYLADPVETLDASHVYMTFEETLETIREIDAMTKGLPKVAYLVGWQYYGHDSKYPAWGEVNEALKRPQDATALDSLLWIMEEGYKYNTSVSLHINIQDAYKDSPLWDEYVREDLFAKNADGSIMEGGFWGCQQAYIVSYKREWDSGYLKRRIDGLCRMLPIQKAGTIHIDAMHCMADPGHGYSIEDVQKVRNQMVRYWRDLGIDVTSEFLYYETPDWRERKEHLVGLQPYAYHFSQNLEDYIARPASLLCGGNSSKRFKEGISDKMGALFGESFDIEYVRARAVRHKEDWKSPFLRNFCLIDVRFFYLNTLERKYAVVDKKGINAYFSDGVVTSLDGTIIKNGIPVQTGDFLALPAVYRGAGSYLLYGIRAGEYAIDMSRAYGLPKDQAFDAAPLTTEGVGEEKCRMELKDGILRVTLTEGQALIADVRA